MKELDYNEKYSRSALAEAAGRKRDMTLRRVLRCTVWAIVSLRRPESGHGFSRSNDRFESDSLEVENKAI